MSVFSVLLSAIVCGAPDAGAVSRGASDESPPLPLVGVKLLDASIQPQAATVTDEIQLQITLSTLQHVAQLEEIDWPNSIPEELEIGAIAQDVLVERHGPQATDAQHWWGPVTRYTVALTPLAPGVYEIAPIEFTVTSSRDPAWSSSVITEPFTVTIESILGEGDDALADIKDPFDPPPDYLRLGAYIAGGVLGAALLAAGVAALARRRPEPAAAPPVPAHETALAELDALLASGMIEQARWKTYFGELSGLLRRYIERRFELHAPTQTTEEFLRDPLTRNMFEPAHDALVRGFLGQADVVKFAEGSMNAAGAREAGDRVRAFIVDTGANEAGGGVVA